MEITQRLCEERRRTIENCLEKSSESIEELEKRQREIEKLSIQIGEILKYHNEKQLDHSMRIQALEKRPVKLWDKAISGFLGAVGGSLAAALLSLII